MSRPRKLDWKKSLLFFLTAFLLASGISLCVLSALLPAPGTVPTVIVCLAVCFALEAFFALPFRGKGFLALGLIAAFTAWGVMGGGPVHSLIQLVSALLRPSPGASAALPFYTDTAQSALCVVISLLAVYMAHRQELPLPCFVVAASGVLCFLFCGEKLILLLPAFAGLLMMLGTTVSLRGAVIPIAAVLTALAFLLTPAQTAVNPALAQTAASIRDFLEDYLFFHEQRAAFTLETEGYKPEKKRLGGAAEPNDRPVMEVETTETLRLRGCTYDAYTGLDWYDSISERRYLFGLPRLESLQRDAFDENLPLTGRDELPVRQLRVKMLGDATTTVFIPQRIGSVRTDSARMVLYFNTASELFITRNLAAGDAYSLTYLSLSPQSEQTRRLISACADVQDDRYAGIAEDYSKLPGHIQKEVREIAAKATANCVTPLEKALALQNYLQKHYKYALNVKTPPENVDFTAWFLLGEKKGYCTYFATAMTVLSRLCGLPARYVTGYLAVPDETGKAVVTGNDAHAWTEIYFNGFGWLEFDATPRGDNEQTGEEPPADRPTPTPTPPPPAATPEPSMTPSATPSPDPDGAQTPTPPPETPESTPVPEQPPMEPEAPRAFPWLPLLLILLILALFLRFLWTEPLRAARRKPQQAAEILLRALLALLAMRHVKRAPQETWRHFGPRADEALQGQGLPPVTPLTDAYAAQVYGRHPADPEPFRQAYIAFRRNSSLPKRTRAALKRMFTRQKRHADPSE